MTNKLMLSVERELLQTIVSVHPSDRNYRIAKEELHALLDEPADPNELSLGGRLARAAAGLINVLDDETGAWTEAEALKRALEDWSIGKPAAQHQGEPVALLSKGFTTLESSGGKYRIITAYQNRDDAWSDYKVLCKAEQPAPVACTSCDGSGEYIDAIGDWRGYCGCPAGLAAKNRTYPPEPVADGTTSDKYKAELYDEVWQKARDMGFANVTDALDKLAAPVAVVMPERSRLRDLIAEAIGGDTYDCTRVWSAWGVGTMSDDDFVPVVEQDERLYEIADSVLAEVTRLNTPQ